MLHRSVFIVVFALAATQAPALASNFPQLSPSTCGWQIVNSANVSGFDGDELVSVRSSGPSNSWAVGDTSDNFSGDYFPLIEHSSGGAWSVVTASEPINTYLASVRIIAPNNVWAVGGQQDQSTFNDRTFVEHWNGASWSVVPSPNVGTLSNDLRALAFRNANDIWAFGDFETTSAVDTLAMHWNGSGWTIVPTPNVPGGENFLEGGGAVSPDDVWAVGDVTDSGLQQPKTLAEHWDGSSWTIVPTPNLGFSSLRSFSPINHTRDWAFGTYINGASVGALAERWNGTSWSIVTTPKPMGLNIQLEGSAALGATNVWAVGQSSAASSHDQTFTMNWNGSTWSIIASPDMGTRDNTLDAVAAIPGTQDLWAVGDFFKANFQKRTLAMKFHC